MKHLYSGSPLWHGGYMNFLVVLFLLKDATSWTGDEPHQCDITDSLYGAKSDNKTVNTVAIQRAIDSCHAISPSWSRVVVPSGAFKTGVE